MLSKLGEALPEAVLRDAMPELDPKNTVSFAYCGLLPYHR